MPATVINTESKIVHLILHLNLVFINKKLYYVHSCRSHVLAVVPNLPDAQNGDNPGTIARRKSPVILISVMPLRENEKVYPVICAQIRSRAATRKTQDIRYSTPFPLGKWRHALVPDVTDGMSYWVVSFV